MKYKGLLIFLYLTTSFMGFSQETIDVQKKNRKGEFFIYWGWNRDWFSKSDIHFKGDNYNFTLKDVRANDKQNKFGLNPYFNLGKITIPQFNLRIGYFFKDNYNISVGIDHMKYVMIANQVVTISGEINAGTAYDGTYTNNDITLIEDFLQFEHTNGLNYINAEIRRFDEVYTISKNMITLNVTEGLGAGILYPKSNVTLLNNERYDEFHLAGYGVHALVGLNLTFFKYFFIQSEFKGGYIDMPDIRTTKFSGDSADQHFFFSQFNWLFGVSFNPF